LRDGVAPFVTVLKALKNKDIPINFHKTNEKRHSHIETSKLVTTRDIDWL
jgi:hypothetical protein